MYFFEQADLNLAHLPLYTEWNISFDYLADLETERNIATGEDLFDKTS